LVSIFLLSVAVGFTSCGKEKGVEGVYVYDSVSLSPLANIVQSIGSWLTGIDKDEMIEATIREADKKTIRIRNDGTIEIKDGEKTLCSGLWFENDDGEISAYFDNSYDYYGLTGERKYTYEKGSLIYSEQSSDGMATVKIKYKKVK